MGEDLGAFFPTPYLDEDFRSIVLRFHRRKGHHEFMHTNKELFRVSKSTKNPYMPRNLEYLVSRLPKVPGFDVDSLLEAHTLYPLVRPLISKDDRGKMQREMREGVSGPDNIASRLLASKESRIISGEIRYCPRCLHEDFDSLGECYIHRLHQIDCIRICHVHKTPLITVCAECNAPLATSSFDTMLYEPRCVNGHKVNENVEDVPKEQLDIQLTLLRCCEQLMGLPPIIDRNDISQRFQIFLAIKGYMNLSGTIRKQQFIDDFSSHIDKSTNSMITVEDISNTKRWFTNDWGLVNIPLFISLVQYLAESVKSLFYSEPSYAVKIPFGAGPWQCLNPICPEFDAPVIVHCIRHLHPSGSKISGEFCCHVCGYRYSSRIHSEEFDAKIHKYKVLSRGHLWEQRLLDMFEQGLSIGKIAKQLRASSQNIEQRLNEYLRQKSEVPKPSISYMAHNEVMESIDQVAAAQDMTSVDSKLLSYRKKVLEVLSGCDGLGREKIRRLAPGAYIWSMKYDREWLDRVLPASKAGKVRLEWDELDVELTAKIQASAAELYHCDISTRISRQRILQSLNAKDRGRMSSGKKHLKKAWTLLAILAESQEDYLVRHIPHLIDKLLESGQKKITFNSILSMRPSYRKCSDQLQLKMREVFARHLSQITNAAE